MYGRFGSTDQSYAKEIPRSNSWSNPIFRGNLETKTIDFVKGHAGFDEIILIYGDQSEPGNELEVGLPLLFKPSLGAIEAGFLYPPEKDGDLRVKMIDSTSCNYITMCGGLTQVLGKAVAETDIGNYFKIKLTEPKTDIILETDSGPIPITMEVADGEVNKVWTNTTSYVEECYAAGVRPVRIGDLHSLAVGIAPPRLEFLVTRVDELERNYPDIDFWTNSEPSLNTLTNLYHAFMVQEKIPDKFLYGAFYDLRPESNGNGRVMFRFYPTNFQEKAKIEMTCGTGTTAIGMAMAANGDVTGDGESRILFEVGSRRVVGRKQMFTELLIRTANGKVVDARFSHSLIELLASGKIYAPITSQIL